MKKKKIPVHEFHYKQNKSQKKNAHGERGDVSPPRQEHFKLEIRRPWLAVRDGGRDVGDGVTMAHFGGDFQAGDDVAMAVYLQV